MRIADDSFLEFFVGQPAEYQRQFLFLEDHPDIRHFWLVDSLDPGFQERLGAALSRHRYLSPFRYRLFAEKAAEVGYEIVFLDDPAPIFAWIDSLDELPDIAINSDFPGTIQGLLPFQIQGYNFAKSLPGTVIQSSTGTGKGVLACALTAHHRVNHQFDLYLWIVKAHNKINSARFLEKYVGLDAIIIDGNKAMRRKLWQEAYIQSTLGEQPIVIANYEVFRSDQEVIQGLVTDIRVWINYDEMPSKLRSRQTQLYRSVCKTLFTSQSNGTFYPSKRIRPKELQQIMLSATPIEKSPLDFYNASRIIAPSLYGSPRKFNETYIAHRNMWGEPDRWKNLDLMGALAAPITFQVDKTSPDIAAQFPQVVYEDLLIDLSADQLRLYRLIMSEYQKMKHDAHSLFTKNHLLSLIQVLQYVCDMPAAIVKTAERWDASGGQEGSEAANLIVKLLGQDGFLTAENNKLEALKEIVQSTESKIVIFAPYNESVLPFLSTGLTEWDVSHVIYHGELSMKDKQAVQDQFIEDPECRVFLSSDAGSDSINLEVADTVINYSLPWAWSTLVQRSNRIHRISSSFKKVNIYTFLCANTIESRKMDILIEKYNYHKAVLMGDINEQAEGLRSGTDLEYILLG